MMNQKVAVVTGSSSGMGYETSLILARNGFHTYATMRKVDGGEGSKQIIDIAKNENLPLEVIQLDVNNDKSVTEAINRIANEKGRIDVVINNAGYDLMGALEEASMDEIKAHLISDEPIQVPTSLMIIGRRSLIGWPAGTSIDSQDTLSFSVLSGVRSMNEDFPLERATEAYDHMMSGKARYRCVLTTGN